MQHELLSKQMKNPHSVRDDIVSDFTDSIIIKPVFDLMPCIVALDMQKHS